MFVEYLGQLNLVDFDHGKLGLLLFDMEVVGVCPYVCSHVKILRTAMQS